MFGCILAVVVATATLCCIFFFNPQRTFQITETYKINSTNTSQIYLNVCLPTSTGYQTVSDYVFDGFEDYFIERYDGWNELTAKIPTKNSETLITITYSVALIRNAQSWDAPLSDAYTQPQQYVDSDNKDIIKFGEQLRGDNDYKTAQNIVKQVNKMIHYPSGSQVNKEQLSASELLKNPVGVCGDNAILMTALLRAEGIPTRMVSGVSLELPLKQAANWSHRGGAHAWVEFFVEGKWHFADPAWGLFDRSDTSHLSYGTYEAYIGSDFQQSRMTAIENMGFYLNGAMSAPLRFMVYSTDENVVVVPRVDVSFSWFG
jgi:hypothetical protein